MNIEKEAMMAKKDVSDMISGLGMALRLLTNLNEKVVARGGNAAMIHFLTTPSGEKNLDKIADQLVSRKWRVPKSIVMQLARKISNEDETSQGAYGVSDEQCFWEPALDKLGIPWIRFASEKSGNNMDEDDRHLDEIKGQLDGKTLQSGMILSFKVSELVDGDLTWKDERYIMTSIGYHDGDPMPGDVIDMDNVDFIHLTPIEYIDPES